MDEDEAYANEWFELHSYVEGLYDEVDKLSRKAPSAPMSDFATGRINRAIREAQSLLAERDRFASDLKEFVPAGDNPEARDAVLVLREIRQALERHEPL